MSKIVVEFYKQTLVDMSSHEQPWGVMSYES